MKIILAGGSGFIGRALAARLAANDHDVVILTRDASGQSPMPNPRVKQVEWNPNGESGPWALEVGSAQAIVNLSGAGIADRRWSAARKALIRSSRVLPTRSLITAMRAAASRPITFIQGSAVGYYGSAHGDHELDESFPPGEDFLGRVCTAWEAEAHPVTALGCRLVIARTGVVVAPAGGAVEQMARPFRFFVGGPVLPGDQYLSWIHIDDWLNFIEWALRTTSAVDAFNVTSPEPVTNRAFSNALGRALHRPSWLPVPGLALKLLFGEMADAMLIHGQRVVPRRALASGFSFTRTTVDQALQHALA